MWLIVCPSTFTFCSIIVLPMKHSLYNTRYGKLMVGCKNFYYILFAYCNLCKIVYLVIPKYGFYHIIGGWCPKRDLAFDSNTHIPC